MSDIINRPDKRHDFLILFDVSDGNPNGDPDAGNMPRVDPETGHGLVTDVCIKRKIRNFVEEDKAGQTGYSIFVREKAVLNNLIDQAHDDPKVKALPEKGGDRTSAAREVMCRTYFDVRTFGAVMSTGKNAGQVRGPVQITFGRSVDPIAAMDVSITRMAVTNATDADKQKGDNRTMGRKALLPYALYVAKGFYTPSFGAQTGTTEDDLKEVWRALQLMWDLDRSAARGMMACRGLYVFTHETALGDAPAHVLFDKISITRDSGVEAPRRFADYRVDVDASMPTGVHLTRLIG